jgi:hypothetical protein
MIKGKNCPLQAEHLRAHASLVREIWNDAAARNPAITAWLNKVEARRLQQRAGALARSTANATVARRRINRSTSGDESR